MDCQTTALDKNFIVRFWHKKRIRVINALVDKYAQGNIVDLGCREVPWNHRALPVTQGQPLCRFGLTAAQLYALEHADAVLLFEVLKHLDFREVLGGICDKLVPGTKMIMCVPFAGPKSLWRPLYRLQCRLVPAARGKQAINPEDLKQCLQHCGMQILEDGNLLGLTYFLAAQKLEMPGEKTKNKA